MIQHHSTTGPHPSISAEVSKACDTVDTNLRERRISDKPVRDLQQSWEAFMPSEVVALPCLAECLHSVKNDPVFYHCLPKKDVTAGVMLGHCLTEVSKILKREYPCVFKIGFTHCLSWRWKNPTYGYQGDRDQYQHMVAVFVSSSAIAAALMEAMLIREHMGHLIALLMAYIFCGVFMIDRGK